MEANVVTESAIVRERPDGTSAVIANLVHGDRLRLGEATFKRAWVEVTLPDGKVGHIRGEVRTRTEPLNHAIVIGGPMKLRASRDMGVEPSIIIPEGQIIATGANSPAQYMSWTEVALADGSFGYVEGEPRAQRIVWAQITRKKVTIRSAPNLSGKPVRTLGVGSIIGIGPAASLAQHPWLRAILPDRTEGFIPPNTSIARLDAAVRLRNLLTFPGKCVCCNRNSMVRICNLHLADNQMKFIGDCLVPVCSRCVNKRHYINAAALFLFGTATVLTTALTGHELVGSIGYVPFGFYFLNVVHKGGTVRRYRQIAEKSIARTLSDEHVEMIDLNIQQEENLDELWPELSKWIICPGCLRLHKHQSAWCPHCHYIFPWRFGPRP